MKGTTPKMCVKCGRDVSQSKRVKDAQGRYYCQPPCGGHAQSSPKATASAPLPACANCGSPFGSLQAGADWQGHKVCGLCLETLRREEEAQVLARAAAAETRVQQEAAEVEARVEEKAAKRSVRNRKIKAMFNRVMVSFFIACWIAIGIFVHLPREPSAPWWQGPAIWGFFLLVLGLLVYLLRQYVLEFKQLSAPDAHLNLAPTKRGFTGAPAGFILPFFFITTLGVAAALIAGGVALSVAFKGDIARLDSQLGGLWQNWGGWIAAGVGLIAAVIFAAFFWDRLTASYCANCRRYWVAQAVSSQHVGSVAGTTTRREKIYSNDRAGRIIAVTDVPVQKQHVTETYEVHCRCSNCGHEWDALRRLTRPA